MDTAEVDVPGRSTQSILIQANVLWVRVFVRSSLGKASMGLGRGHLASDSRRLTQYRMIHGHIQVTSNLLGHFDTIGHRCLFLRGVLNCWSLRTRWGTASAKSSMSATVSVSGLAADINLRIRGFCDLSQRGALSNDRALPLR